MVNCVYATDDFPGVLSLFTLLDMVTTMMIKELNLER